ncbi:hypothetical protein [Kurthia huakuii]|uniref:hypothetical protein n=1 Tax=Kurthia huakuii TaxID=1421019 RepID=UPI000497079A|nr:hypothetical protein [Kurthia huakuii]MBM7698587.1 cytochrome c biogenesis protein CcdA [Kurthia huakuii]
MKPILYITMFFTGLATIFVWMSMNVLTPDFDIDLYKANADGLYNSFYFQLGFIFIVYFAVATVIMLRNFHRMFNARMRIVLLVLYGVLTIFIVFRTMRDVFQLKNALNSQQTDVVFSMINAYSTNIYFNTFTFVGFIIFLALISLLIPASSNHREKYEF